VSLPESSDQPASSEPPFDPTSWVGALSVMLILDALLWVIEFVNAGDGYRLDRFGLRPRVVSGLEGVVAAPLLHASYAHLLANSAPFVLLGWVVLLSGVRPFAMASGLIVVLGGLATWAVAPGYHNGAPVYIVGASGLIMGWLGYLLARAYFARRIAWIVVAVLVLFFFGGMLGGLLPSLGSEVSWQGHVCGFLGGVAAGWLLHPRNRRAPARSVS
jgi:membrane associated rhomboid family serine protease